MADKNDPFEPWTTLPVADATALLPRFEQEGIRFEIAPEQSQITGLNAHAASLGGTFGHGAQVQIFIHQDDAEQAERIWSEFCGFEN